jgi:hypothetical protein
MMKGAEFVDRPRSACVMAALGPAIHRRANEDAAKGRQVEPGGDESRPRIIASYPRQ